MEQHKNGSALVTSVLLSIHFNQADTQTITREAQQRASLAVNSSQLARNVSPRNIWSNVPSPSERSS